MENMMNVEIINEFVALVQDNDYDGAMKIIKEASPSELDELAETLKLVIDPNNPLYKRLLNEITSHQPCDLAEGWRRSTKAEENLRKVRKGNRGFSVK